MNETEKGKKHQGLMIAGLIVLILALMLGVTLIFAGLEAMVPASRSGQTAPPGSQSASASQSREEAVPSFCPFCGEALHESFQWGQFCPWCGEKVEG